MRWKVFHGRKSMICANRVLPRYMTTPGWRHPERLCKPPFPIQVGDALCHPKSPAAIGFLTNTSQVNRTVLTSYLKSVLLWLQEYWTGPVVRVYPLRPVQASLHYSARRTLAAPNRRGEIIDLPAF